jgi:2-hydroxychromene-2-carboxylate isomerase
MTMTDPAATTAPLPELDGGPHDIEFFFDPACPFAWQTSQWIRRVQELRGIRVGWRFISLKIINEGNDELPDQIHEAHLRSIRYHRICAAARAELGNDAVGDLYRAWGERFWYRDGGGEPLDRLADAADDVDPAAIIAELDLPAHLLDAADDDSWDAVLRAESDEAFRRTGDGVGTPIITYLPGGNSLFGPVISSVPDDDAAVAFYDALRTFADFAEFSELKRSNRAPLDLPLLREAS